jgi:hypothetical protein
MEPVRFETMAAEYSRAFRSARTAKNLLVLFILLALLVQIGAVVLVHFVGVLNPIAEPARAATNTSASQPSWNETVGAVSNALGRGGFRALTPQGAATLAGHEPEATTAPAIATTGPATTPAASTTQPAAGTASSEPARKPFLSLGPTQWGTILCWGMSASKFVAMVFGLMLVFTLMLTMDLSLLGRLGGVAGFVGAFFWSLLLLAMLIPWHEAIRMGLACGATHSLAELQADIQNLQSVGAKTFSWALAGFYARFLAYPAIALAILLIVQAKFAKGYRLMTTSTTTG